MSVDDVFDAIGDLKSRKKDSVGISSAHLRFLCPVIADSLASLFTAILHHGYMSQCFRNSTLIPILKGGKTFTCNDNYHPISLASTIYENI